jgi:tetratricopeptide (TPR) repeat protein
MMIKQAGIQKKNLNLTLICLALVLLTIIAFWPVKNCDFINFDDNLYVYENGYIQNGVSWHFIKWAFSADSSKVGHWHPITWLSLMLDYKFFGLNPSGYHLMNLLFHILNTILLFLIFQRMTKALWQSAFVAALFAIHPLHVESVAWVTERKDVLSTFFWMLTMGAYVFYVERKTFSRYFIILVLFTVGLMSKAMLVTLPFVLILLDYWPLNRFQATQPSSDSLGKWQRIHGLVWEKIPIFVLAGVFSVIPILAAKNAHAMNTSLSFIERFGNAFQSYVLYLRKMVWPSDLAFFYPYPVTLHVWQILVAVLILTMISAFALWERKNRPYLLFGWLWYLSTLLPVIGIIQAGEQAYADRYTYIPLIGVFIMITWGITSLKNKLPYSKILWGIVASILIVTLVVVTRIQVSFWQNSETLMTHALVATEDNYVAYDHLAMNMKRQGRIEEALTNLTEAIRANPSYAEAHNNIATILGMQGRMDEAMAHLVKAMQINPNDAAPYNNMGNIIFYMKNVEGAIKYYSKALEIDPEYAEANNNIGAILTSQGKLEEAKSHILIALQNKRDYADAYYNLALILISEGKLDEAAKNLSDLVYSNPGMYKAHYQLGVIAARQGKYDEAVAHFQDTLHLRPDFDRARNDLENALNRQKRMP